MSACDKCGIDVHPANNVVQLNVILGRSSGLVFSRHLMPHRDENGALVCEGSPSRAQFLRGQPRDPRPEYPYDLEKERRYRAAYAALLAQHEGTTECETLRTAAEWCRKLDYSILDSDGWKGADGAKDFFTTLITEVELSAKLGNCTVQSGFTQSSEDAMKKMAGL